MATLLQDIRYAFRVLLKTPGFVLVTVLTLALGIGANTALFSIVNAVLLNPLPFPDSDRLVTFYESKPHFEKGSFSYLDFEDLQQQNQSFSAMGAYRETQYAMTSPGTGEQVYAEMVSAEVLPMIGVKPIAGRLFTKNEDRLDAEPVVLLDAEFWEQKFSSSTEILNKVVTLDGRNYTVVGVVPGRLGLDIQNFGSAKKINVYTLMGQFDDPAFRDRANSWGTDGIARLKPGVTIEQARAELVTLTHRLAVMHPAENAGISATVLGLKEEMVGDVRPILLVLLGAVGFVLLIACVNVANLLLVRATGRSREFAVRVALGASQGRLVRQLLTESVLLGLAGGAFGLLLAAWGTQAALALLPTALPRSGNVSMDGHVMLFTFAISTFSGILFGLTPALRMARSNAQASLKEGGRVSTARQRTQSVFVAVEMALALVLLIGAGLMIRTLRELWNAGAGFDPHQVLMFGISTPLPSAKPTPAMLNAGLRKMHDAVASIPGVNSLSLSWGATPMRGDEEEQLWIEGEPKPTDANQRKWTLRYVVEPDYFDTMRISLLRGRLFTQADDERSAPVALVDDRFAKQYFAGADPIGKYLNLMSYQKKVQIVGVVNHVKQFGLSADDTSSLHAQIYLPIAQSTDQPSVGATLFAVVFVRSSESLGRLSDTIRQSLQQTGANQIMTSPSTMEETVLRSVRRERFLLSLLGIFAGLALLLSSIGIYGVVSYLVGLRTHEIGIRMALGAQEWDVLRLIMGSGLRMALVGVVIGFLASLAATRLLINMLYGVKPFDPLTFVCVVVVLSVVTMLACYAPARKASKVEPLVALRYE